ncbi:MAG: PIN domain-containing protein [Elusimicrobia bacterium]|nr:PIN domain-containing protein [Elusimicrobiota bacterium]
MTLIDTNILVYAWLTNAPGHERARSFLSDAFNRRGEFCLAPQVLWEFFSVVTHPKKTNPPIAASVAAEIVESMMHCGLSILIPSLKANAITAELLKNFPQRRGGLIFDLYLAATALEHGVNQICTADLKHFENIQGLSAVNPLQ